MLTCVLQVRMISKRSLYRTNKAVKYRWGGGGGEKRIRSSWMRSSWASSDLPGSGRTAARQRWSMAGSQSSGTEPRCTAPLQYAPLLGMPEEQCWLQGCCWIFYSFGMMAIQSYIYHSTRLFKTLCSALTLLYICNRSTSSTRWEIPSQQRSKFWTIQ